MFFQWGWSSHISEQTPQSNSHIYRCTAIAKIESCFWIDGLSMSNALGGIRIISIQRQCCSKMALKSRKKGSILGRNCRTLIHLFLHYFFIFRALSKIRYVILNLGRVIQSFTGSYLIGSLFERWIIKIWMNSLCTEGRHRITLFLLSKKIFWNSCLRYLSFSFIRPTFQIMKWYVHNSE